jgi:hypothetical protein
MRLKEVLTMQAYLIDPHKWQVTPVDYSGNWRDISKLIEADRFDVVTTPEGMSVYVDDDGLFQPDQAFFVWERIPQPLAGKALVLGPVDAEGETQACWLTLEQVQDLVVFGHVRELVLYSALMEA